MKLFVEIVVLQTICLGVSNSMDMFGLINTLYFKADQNMDGLVSEQELNNVYQGFDENGDQKVTQDEFTSLWKTMTEQSQEMASAYFYLADINDNGVITDDDIRPVYNRFDLDGDGRVEAREFNVKWQEIYHESPFAVLYLRTDKNQDDDLQKDEYPLLFASLDNKADGSVSKANFINAWVNGKFGDDKDARALFSKMDPNGDGTATTSEVGAFLKGYDVNGNGNIEILEVVQLVKLLPPM